MEFTLYLVDMFIERLGMEKSSAWICKIISFHIQLRTIFLVPYFQSNYKNSNWAKPYWTHFSMQRFKSFAQIILPILNETRVA